MLVVIGGIGGGAYYFCLRRRRNKAKQVSNDEINMEVPAIIEESGFNGKLLAYCILKCSVTDEDKVEYHGNIMAHLGPFWMDS